MALQPGRRRRRRYSLSLVGADTQRRHGDSCHTLTHDDVHARVREDASVPERRRRGRTVAIECASGRARKPPHDVAISNARATWAKWSRLREPALVASALGLIRILSG